MSSLQKLIELIIEQEYQTKKGEDIEFAVKPHDNFAGQDTGWVLYEITAMIDGFPVGYIKISYIPKEHLKTHKNEIVSSVEMKYGRGDKFEKGMQEFVDFHVDKPLVDYIRVKKHAKRQRIGVALYEYAAKWLAKRGLKLYASGIQSDDAKHSWEWLKNNKGANIGTEKDINGKTRTFLSF